MNKKAKTVVYSLITLVVVLFGLGAVMVAQSYHSSLKIVNAAE